MQVFLCKSNVRFHIFICSIFILYTFLYVHISFNFIYEPICVPLCEASECILCLSACTDSFVTCLPLLLWPSKSNCEITFTGKINLVFSVISLIKILAKLLQMIWVYPTSFVVCQSVCLFLSVSLRELVNKGGENKLKFRKDTYI